MTILGDAIDSFDKFVEGVGDSFTNSIQGSSTDIWGTIGKAAASGLSSAASKALSGGSSGQSQSYKPTSRELNEGTINGSSKVAQSTPSRALQSVDINELELRWIARMSTYGRK